MPMLQEKEQLDVFAKAPETTNAPASLFGSQGRSVWGRGAQSAEAHANLPARLAAVSAKAPSPATPAPSAPGPGARA